MRKKILAVASIGGHWVELLRITRPLEGRYEVWCTCRPTLNVNPWSALAVFIP